MLVNDFAVFGVLLGWAVPIALIQQICSSIFITESGEEYGECKGIAKITVFVVCCG